MSHSDSGSSGGDRERPGNSTCSSGISSDEFDEPHEEPERDDDHELVDAREEEINVDSLELLELEGYQVDAVQEALRLLVARVPSSEALGEAVYTAIFEAAPSLQGLFHTPKAVQAMRFVNALIAFISNLGNPEKLKMLAESLAFGHLATDVTVPRAIIFRDALVELMSVELEEKFTSDAYSALKMLLNYMGGAMIFVKAHYSERLTLLVKSWKNANPSYHNEEGSPDPCTDDEVGAKEAGKAEDGAEGDSTGGDALMNSMQMASQKVPKDFPEMFYFNATVMGFADRKWFKEVLSVFQNIVVNVANSTRLQEECEVLILRIVRVAKAEEIDFSEFQSCMLASLRSLLPQEWSAEHEVAWTWLWENVHRILEEHLVSAPKWHRSLKKFLANLTESSRFELRNGVYARFFEVAPSGQLFFKQSNTYLHFIADRIIGMTLDMYEDPAKMVDDISALGLRHVGYGIQTELLGPFVSSFCDVVATAQTEDSMVAPSMRWSIGLIGKILTRTINEGSTIVMKAINANAPEKVVSALALAARGERFKWSLLIKVGTQSISPLSWSIESGSYAATKALLEDLLTIRADRDRYYYGADDLFSRHPDIIQRLCSEAPALLWTLFDGLVWRARMTTDGQRRVNYFMKHLVVAPDGTPTQAIEWIEEYQDPRLVCHPLIETTSNILWLNVVYHLFLRGRAWFLLTMCLFMTYAIDATGTQEDAALRTFVFCCRMFIYVFALPQLLFVHVRKVCKAFKTKAFKRYCFIPVPHYWKGRQGSCGVALTVAMSIMLIHEPMLWCLSSYSKDGFTAGCSDADFVSEAHRLFSSVAMLLYFMLLLDLAVCSNRLLVFVLLCGQMAPELLLFIMALGWTTALVACIGSALESEVEAFDGINVSGLSLLKISMGIFPSYDLEHLEVNAAITFLSMAFSVFGLAFLANVLVAQLTCSYQAVWKDMVGYARLSRMKIIAELLPRVNPKAWQRFIQAQGYHNRLEFNPGDVGLSGGIQVLEPAHRHPTLVDTIHRHGGSTSQSKPWPSTDEELNTIDKQFEGLEAVLKKTLKKIGHGRRGGSGSNSMSWSSSSSGTMSATITELQKSSMAAD